MLKLRKIKAATFLLHVLFYICSVYNFTFHENSIKLKKKCTSLTKCWNACEAQNIFCELQFGAPPLIHFS